MINLYSTQIDHLSAHKIGNKNRNETLFLSQEPLSLDSEQSTVLKEYFLKLFREKEENYYCFTYDVDLEFHDLYNCVGEMLAHPKETHEVSKKIATRLFEQSNHPHIKRGELYVAHLSGMIIDEQKVNGIGIFKSESKCDFLKFKQTENSFKVIVEQGVNTQKLDKGCIIFNIDEAKGYKILSIDTNRYDTRYWLEKFLGVKQMRDNRFFTKHYLNFCKNFAKDVVFPSEDKQQEVLFMNKAVNHFAKNDKFREDDFLEEVIQNPSLIPEFHSYKEEKGKKYSVEDVSSFPIVDSAVSEVRKAIKNTISLDTNIQIKMDFVNPDSLEKFVEKGWDEEKQMYYYLVYFNREQKV